MCGISGFQGLSDISLLSKMNDSLAHRGPDDEGVWFDKDSVTGLAQRRLSIIDTSSSGAQPMTDVNDRAVITFNGEIYNYKELHKSLDSKGYKFKSSSDTEVLLNMYLEYGTDMLADLNGIFAFAIWDKKQHILFLARDGLGVKPLYFHEKAGVFIFASEIKSILLIPGIKTEINYKALYHYTSYLWCPAPDTMLTSVKKLEPGNALIVQGGVIKRKWQFYELPYVNTTISKISVQDACDQLDHHLSEAVRRQMVADVPVGTFLSGGLDSTAITQYARQHTGKDKLQSFSIGFKDNLLENEGFINDLPYAQKASEILDVDLNVINVGTDMIDNLAMMIYHLDEPQADPAAINAYFICKLAREKGIKVLLSGAGGDDVFTGYRRHFALQQEKYWSWMPKPFRHLLKYTSGLLPVSNPAFRRMKKAFNYAHLNGNERIASYFHWIDPQHQMQLFSSEVLREVSSFPFSEPLVQSLNTLPDDIHPLNKMLFLEAKHFLADHNLNYTDKMSMATGVEVRVPFLDPDLISFAASLPVNYKQNGMSGKWIFKKSMERYIPKDIIYRPKCGFGAPLRYWLKNDLAPVVNDILSEKSLTSRGLFNAEGVKRLIKLDKSNKIDGSYTIFSLMCIEMWCRIFLDKRITF